MTTSRSIFFKLSEGCGKGKLSKIFLISLSEWGLGSWAVAMA